MNHQNLLFFVKVVVSGVIIASVSSLSKIYPKWAALLTALPLTTFLSLIWIYIETKDMPLIATYTRDVFFWVLPSLLFFVVAMFLFKTKWPFILSMGVSTLALFIGVVIFEKLHLLK